MGYKILGFIVWQVTKGYLKTKVPDRRLIAAGAVAAGITALLVESARRNAQS